jgi:hypothetical protein
MMFLPLVEVFEVDYLAVGAGCGQSEFYVFRCGFEFESICTDK